MWDREAPLAVGEDAPDFTLRTAEGGEVTLSALRGREVVLVFYPADDTRECTRQLCEMRDEWPSVAPAGALVFGVNRGGAESHRRFAAKFGLTFPLLVDEGGRVAKRYRAGGWIPRRTVYRVGADGKIKFGRRGSPTPAEVWVDVDDD